MKKHWKNISADLHCESSGYDGLAKKVENACFRLLAQWYSKKQVKVGEILAYIPRLVYNLH